MNSLERNQNLSPNSLSLHKESNSFPPPIPEDGFCHGHFTEGWTLRKPEETQMDGLEKCVYQKLIWNNIYSTV